jgi:NAD(P)-dependent dehydrogenase (short-subunit alcohol dehydrogenase family)
VQLRVKARGGKRQRIAGMTKQGSGEMSSRLAGKVIAIGGAGSIGGAVAKRIAAEGGAVAIGDMDGANAKAVAAEITASGGKAFGMTVEIGDDASVGAFVAQAVKSFGGLDGFHANAANFTHGTADTDALDIPLEIFDDIMRVNARGFLLCTRHAVPELVKRGGGTMLYTSSGAAYGALKTLPAYAMSKNAVHGLMRHVASRWGEDRVRANVIAPGVIMHEKLARSIDENFHKWAHSRLAVKGRLGQVEDIAAMAALLFSDEGAYITGQVINIDGGATMRA